ncbi:unnamed protein product [Durusdinium trenchii]|uniref:CCDC81 HU domain-containing protein n=1 Tax=Durusdinium trenchii TaxID=1381693 RepID=A0ABP0RD02_9DINO
MIGADAVPLPISKWVDRTLCAEFQLLSEVCDMLHRSGVSMTCPELRYAVEGCLNLYLSQPSCVSCIGVTGLVFRVSAMKQFQTLLPGVDLFVEFGSLEPSNQSWAAASSSGSCVHRWCWGV